MVKAIDAYPADRVNGPMPEDDDLMRWSRLTDKQRACLDLLVERKTSKEIARILEIAKPTVDQRITAARTILGVDNRDQAAVVYARLRRQYDQVTYDPVQVLPAPKLVPSDFPDGDPNSVLKLSDSFGTSFSTERGQREMFQPFRDRWRPDHGVQARVLIMVGILAALVIIVFLGLGIAEALKRLVSS